MPQKQARKLENKKGTQKKGASYPIKSNKNKGKKKTA